MEGEELDGAGAPLYLNGPGPSVVLRLGLGGVGCGKKGNPRGGSLVVALSRCGFFAFTGFTFASFSFFGLSGLGVRGFDWKSFGIAGKSERADEAGGSIDPSVDIDQRLRSARSGSYSSSRCDWQSYGSELRKETVSGAGLQSLCITLGAPKSSERLEGEKGSEAPSKGEMGSSLEGMSSGQTISTNPSWNGSTKSTRSSSPISKSISTGRDERGGGRVERFAMRKEEGGGGGGGGARAGGVNEGLRRG